MPRVYVKFLVSTDSNSCLVVRHQMQQILITLVRRPGSSEAMMISVHPPWLFSHVCEKHKQNILQLLQELYSLSRGDWKSLILDKMHNKCLYMKD